MRTDSPSLALSSLLSVVIIIGANISIIALARVIYNFKAKKMLESEEFKSKYGNLTSGLNVNSTIGTYWNILVMLRWNITSIILVTLRDYYAFQMLSLLFISFVMQMLIVAGKPLKDDKMMSLLNEAMVSLYLYLLLILTDYNG